VPAPFRPWLLWVIVAHRFSPPPYPLARAPWRVLFLFLHFASLFVLLLPLCSRPSSTSTLLPHPLLCHCCVLALPPLCAGKPSSKGSQVECPSRRQSEAQPRAKLTPARSCQGHPTLLSSLPRAATGASFLWPLPSSADLLARFISSKCCSLTHQSTPATRGPLLHRHSPPAGPRRRERLCSSEILLPVTPKIESLSPHGAS
jgi:hypothetical protein